MRIDPFLSPCTKLKSKWIKELHIKPKTLKFIEEEVEKTLNGISIAAKNGEQSILSMQGVEKILADIGYNGYEIYHIMQDIKGMDSIQMLDFGYYLLHPFVRQDSALCYLGYPLLYLRN